MTQRTIKKDIFLVCVVHVLIILLTLIVRMNGLFQLTLAVDFICNAVLTVGLGLAFSKNSYNIMKWEKSEIKTFLIKIGCAFAFAVIFNFFERYLYVLSLNGILLPVIRCAFIVALCLFLADKGVVSLNKKTVFVLVGTAIFATVTFSLMNLLNWFLIPNLNNINGLLGFIELMDATTLRAMIEFLIDNIFQLLQIITVIVLAKKIMPAPDGYDDMP